MSLIKDTPERYGLASQILHWGLAMLAAAAYVSGEAFTEAAREDKGEVMYWHASLSLLLVGFFVVRALWRVQQTSPQELNSTPALVWAHKGAILALYALPVVITLTGVYAVQSVGRPVPFFGIEFLSGWEFKDRELHDTMESAHVVLSHVVFLVVIVHMLAGLWHQFVRRDGALARMLPFSLKA